MYIVILTCFPAKQNNGIIELVLHEGMIMMRSDLMLKLTRTHCDDTSGEYKDVMISGPHDYLLVEMRLEELKKNPDMTLITPEKMNFSEPIFALAVNWLMKKGYISGAIIKYAEGSKMPVGVDLSAVKLTPEGIEYEKRLG